MPKNPWMGDNDRVLGADHGNRVLRVPKDMKAGANEPRTVISVVDAKTGKVLRQHRVKAPNRGSFRLPSGTTATISAKSPNGETLAKRKHVRNGQRISLPPVTPGELRQGQRLERSRPVLRQRRGLERLRPFEREFRGGMNTRKLLT